MLQPLAMHADDRDICAYLKTYPGQYVALAEICRRAGGKRRFEKEPYWAVEPLRRMMDEGTVEADGHSHYRLRRTTDKKKKQKKQPGPWLSPEVRKILEESKKKFAEGVVIEEEAVADEPPGPNL